MSDWLVIPKELADEIVAALNRSIVLYAPEFCRAELVEKTRNDVLDKGGYLAYIADLRDRLAASETPQTINTDKPLKEVVTPVIEWLAKNKHPHTSIVIDSTHAELLEGIEVVHTEEFLQD